jgi:hypothetical protein
MEYNLEISTNITNDWQIGMHTIFTWKWKPDHGRDAIVFNYYIHIWGYIKFKPLFHVQSIKNNVTFVTNMILILWKNTVHDNVRCKKYESLV